MSKVSFRKKNKMEIVHLFVFLRYNKRQQRNEPIDHSLYSQTPRACTMLCNL